jgi:pimeloyl-ACP methyl ester carboxylesterase
VQAESVADDLHQIGVPTLLIWGRDDRITPPDVAHVLHRGIADARLEFISSCGHAPMMERPGVFNRLALEFLGEVVGKRVLLPAG